MRLYGFTSLRQFVTFVAFDIVLFRLAHFHNSPAEPSAHEIGGQLQRSLVNASLIFPNVGTAEINIWLVTCGAERENADCGNNSQSQLKHEFNLSFALNAMRIPAHLSRPVTFSLLVPSPTP